MVRGARPKYIPKYERKTWKNSEPKTLKRKTEKSPFLGQNKIEPQILISEELLAEMKKMNPQALMNSLINPVRPNSEEQEEQEEYELTDSMENQEFFDWSHTPEPEYERPIPTRELCEQMMTMSREQVRYLLTKSLAF